MERCVCLADLHYRLQKEKSPRMLEVCDQLLQRLGQQRAETCFVETVGLRHIQFEVRVCRRELGHAAVRLHFEQCLQLLRSHSSHQNAFTILTILSDRLSYFQQFEFPLESILAAHVEFEQYRHFYSEVCTINVDDLVNNTYRNEMEAVPEGAISEPAAKYLRLKLKREELLRQGNYR